MNGEKEFISQKKRHKLTVTYNPFEENKTLPKVY